jgi:hypothetical protein
VEASARPLAPTAEARRAARPGLRATSLGDVEVRGKRGYLLETRLR